MVSIGELFDSVFEQQQHGPVAEKRNWHAAQIMPDAGCETLFSVRVILWANMSDSRRRFAVPCNLLDASCVFVQPRS